MADPLSVATAVITLVEATAKISSMCRKYYKSARGSQKVIQRLLSEIQTLRTITERLDVRLLDDAAADSDSAGDGDDSDRDDDDDCAGRDQSQRDSSLSDLPIIQSLMNDGGVFEQCVACLRDLEQRLEEPYNVWFSQKQSQKEPTEANGTWHKQKGKVREMAMRLVWPLKESEVKETMDTIHRLCNVIQLAMGANIVFKVEGIDRKTDAVHRAVTDIQRTQATKTTLEDTKKAAEAAAQEKERRLRQRIAVCSWLDGSGRREAKNEAAYKLRAPNTSMWLLESEPFTAWKTGSEPRKTFWLQAIPGGGKTVLASTVIHHLEEQLQPVPAALAYFYFDASDNNMTTTDRMLRSLLAQLVRHVMVKDAGSLPEPVMRLASKCLREHRLGGLFTQDPTADSSGDTDAAYDIKEGDYGVSMPPTNEVLTALQEAAAGLVRSGQNIYVVIDALDECTDLETLCHVLHGGLARAHGSSLDASSENMVDGAGSIRLFCTSRHVPSLVEVFDSRTTLIMTANTEAGQNEDIDSMVRQQLKQDKKLRGWSSMHDEMQKALTSRAQGMFRLAACQLDILRKCKTLRSLKDALKTLPTTLSDTYKRTIMAVDKDDRAYAVRALLWLAASERPLTLREMVDILAVIEDADEDSATGEDPGFVFDEEQRINDLADIPALCTTLVQTVAVHETEADADDLELRFAHHTVREFVLSKAFLMELVSNDQSLPAFLRRITDQRTLHEHVATTLLSYLLCLQDHVPNHIGMTMCARENVRRKDCCEAEEPLQIGETVFNPGCLLTHQLQNRPLASYAACQWDFHFREAWRTDTRDSSALVTQAMQLLGPESSSHDNKGGANMTLSYVNMIRIRHNRFGPVARYLFSDFRVSKPPGFAAMNNLDMLVLKLVQVWDKHLAHVQDAAIMDRPDLVIMMLEMDTGSWGPLTEAALQGDHALFDILLNHAAKLDNKEVPYNALSNICRHDCVDFVRKLLPLDVNLYDALFEATFWRAVNCIELLLPLVSISDKTSALEKVQSIWRIVEEEDNEKVLALYSKHIPLTVLSYAPAYRFHDLISDILSQLLGAGDVAHMRQLLSSGTLDLAVPVCVKDGPDAYPLHLAVLSGKADLVRLFLEYGAAGDTVDACNGTALALAAYANDLELVRLLVEEGHASLTEANSTFGSPVQAVLLVLSGRRAKIEEPCVVLEYLLTHGADANQVVQPADAASDDHFSNTYDTPLCLAARFVSNPTALAVSAVLLKHGADPNLIAKPCGGRTARAPLHEAIANKDMDLVKFLLASGANANARAAGREQVFGLPRVPEYFAYAADLRPLSFAIMGGMASIVQVLINAGADVNASHKMESDVAMDISMLAFCSLYTAEIRNMDSEFIVMMRMLLDAGANPQRHNRIYGFYEPLLHTISATLAGSEAKEMMHLLVADYSVDVNAAADDDGDSKSEGWTALLRAAYNPDPDLLAYLLDELGADPHVQMSDGRYAVHVAAACDNIDVLDVLAKHLGMNLCSHSGRTPLHEAAAKGAVDAVEWLLQKGGADVTLRDAAGLMARDCASQGSANELQKMEMLELLDEAVRQR